MPAQVAILSRKILVSGAALSWVSEPMYWGGYKRSEMYLEIHGIGDTGNATAIALTFEGSTHPGENATWTTMAACTPADPSAPTAISVVKYVREDLFPYVRVSVALSGVTSGMLLIAEVSVNGTLHEDDG